MKAMEPVSKARVVSAGVLCGVYTERGGVQLTRGAKQRTHALMLDGQGRKLLVLCGKVRLDNLAEDYDLRPVDCPRCIRATRKVAAE